MAHRRKFVLSVPFPSEKRPFCGSFSATLCPILSPGSTLARGTEWALIEMYVFTSLDSLDPQENPLHRWAWVPSAVPGSSLSHLLGTRCITLPSSFQGQCGHVTCFGQWRVSTCVHQPLQVDALRASTQFTTSLFHSGASSQQYSRQCPFSIRLTMMSGGHKWE